MSAVVASQPNGTTNGLRDGVNGHTIHSRRFEDIPRAIDIPVHGDDDEQAVEVDLEDLLDDPTELCTLLENEGAARTYWMTVSLAYAKQKKVDHAIEMLKQGGQVMKGGPKEKLSVLTCLTWMYLWKAREAPRVAPEGALASETKSKDYFLKQCTTTLNDAMKINPAFPALFMARGVLQLMRASLETPSGSAAAPGSIDSKKMELLRASVKSFDDAIRISQRRNMLAVMGKARALFSLGRYGEALEGYQEALTRMPALVDPDPRIGIGCCFWQLNYKEDAKTAWERALEVNPDSKIANILLGLFYLDSSSHVPTNSPEFVQLYKKAMFDYAQTAFKADKNLPLTCATFANYYLSKRMFDNVDKLAHKAIQFTDVNAIASDGWYLLARKEHYAEDINRAADYYRRADEARGGADRGYLPAKFGSAQLSVLKGDIAEAKLRLEKIIQQSKNAEAMVLLGTLYAEEVFTSQSSGEKDEKLTETKKAISYLESVRNLWKDPKKNISPDPQVLLNLARLYETEQPEKSLQCLLHVEQIEIANISDSEKPEGDETSPEYQQALRECLLPQLLNNQGCLLYQSDKFEQAEETFQTGLNACMKAKEKQASHDIDSLIVTISYNLARAYEANGKLEAAGEVYNSLLKSNPDYIEAKARLAFITFKQSPTEEGPKAMTQLHKDAPTDMEVRAMYGWFLGRANAKKRPSNIAEDPEQRQYKHTLQQFDKHDRYSLVGMGNLYLTTAREMRRESEQDKQKRSINYGKAVEFFDKALQLDEKNAYAAQGLAIALVEDKKDYKTALSIFMKIRDTVKDSSVFVNLGHIFQELKQFTKAIEHYELALTKDRAGDAQILTCLGKTWLAKGKVEKSVVAFKRALDYSQQALAVAPEQIHFKFNIAFVQLQLATAVYNINEHQRTLAEVEEAAAGLEAAIASLEAIAQHPQAPYPKHDIEQRANMAKNTMRKQLERSVQAQKEYESKNAEKLKTARNAREAEIKKREDAKREAEAIEKAKRDKIAAERLELAERDRELAELRRADELAREAAELTTDSETGDRVKRKKKPKPTGGKRKKKNEDGITEDDESGDDRRSGSEKPSKKKRKLAKKSAVVKVKENSKYKSSEIVVESDDDDDDGRREAEAAMSDEKMDDVVGGGGSDEEEETAAPVQRKSRRARLDSDDDEDEDVAPVQGGSSPATAKGDGDEDTRMKETGGIGEDDSDE